MKIRDDILSAVGGSTIAISKLSVADEEKIEGSPCQDALSVTIGDQIEKDCFECASPAFDCCWNCERPICKNHAHAVFSAMILAICYECTLEFVKYAEERGLSRDKV